MSSDDQVPQKSTQPIPNLTADERIAYKQFLLSTPFGSSATEEEKYAAFKFHRRIEKRRERKRKIAEYGLRRHEQRERDTLNRQRNGQPPGKSGVKQSTRLAAGHNRELSTGYSGLKIAARQNQEGGRRLRSNDRRVRPAPLESRESTATEEPPVESSESMETEEPPAAEDTAAQTRKTNMVPRKNVQPDQVDANALERQKRQLRCINRTCSNGDTLTPAIQSACTYYDVKYKSNKEVCLKCLTECLQHYRHLETKFRKGECIMDAKFPRYDSHFVIEDSSSGEEEQPQQLQEPRPSTSRESLPLSQNVTNAINSVVQHFFHNNKHLIHNQIKLCKEYFDKEIKKCLNNANEIEQMATDLEREMASLKKDLFDQYKPFKTELKPVDLNELEMTKKEQEEEVNMLEEVKTLKLTKMLKPDTSDKEDVVTIDRTVCVVPANIPVEGILVYPRLKAGYTIYGKEFTLLQPWRKCTIKYVVNEDYVNVKFEKTEKLLTTHEVAFFNLNPVRFPVGCRVIAKFTDPDSNHAEKFYAGVVAEPPKMLNNFRYLIFFDNGFAQYHQHEEIRLTARRTYIAQVYNIVHQNTSEFIKNYLEKYPDRQMVRLTNQHSVRAEHKNQWQMAKVVKVDASLVKLYFTDFKYSEWVYRGSTRLYNIFEKQFKDEKGIRLRQSGLAYLNKPFVEYTSVEEEPEPNSIISKNVARKSTSKNSSSLGERNQKCNKNKIKNSKIVDVLLPKSIPEPFKYIEHKCTPLCIEWTAYDYNKTKHISMLIIPLHFGFVRYSKLLENSHKCIMYKTPCGVSIQNIKQMLEYLLVTGSTMTIDQFDFNNWVRPFAEFKISKCVRFIKDISESKEFRGIPCVNTINSILPPRMHYMTTRKPMPGVNINVESDFLCGCDCTDNCQDKSKCACWQMTIDGQKILPNIYNDPNLGYSYRRLPERVLTGIYECNKTCKCSSSCLNRVVQNPLSQKLQLFMTENKGWGVQCLNDIPQGSFICIYVGYLLTETDANEGGKNYGDEYLAELDYIEVVEKIKEDFESEVPNSDHENESESSDEYLPNVSDGKKSDISSRLRKRKKLKTKKDGKREQALSKLNARNMKNPVPPKPIREYFGNNESVYIMDAKTSGNIGRYLNHSCSPNIFVQNVFVDTHDLRFPWISFFALHYIPAGTELTWNYSYDVGSVPGKKLKCHCESAVCRGRLL